MISSLANLVYKLPPELQNDLRLRILGNKKILGKYQIWVEKQPSNQSLLKKLNFGSNSQKTCKSRYQTFLVLSSFTGFLYFVPNILPRIVIFEIFCQFFDQKVMVMIKKKKITFQILFYQVSDTMSSSLYLPVQ